MLGQQIITDMSRMEGDRFKCCDGLDRTLYSCHVRGINIPPQVLATTSNTFFVFLAGVVEVP